MFALNAVVASHQKYALTSRLNRSFCSEHRNATLEQAISLQINCVKNCVQIAGIYHEKKISLIPSPSTSHHIIHPPPPPTP
jgi:hypothetical protein